MNQEFKDALIGEVTMNVKKQVQVSLNKAAKNVLRRLLPKLADDAVAAYEKTLAQQKDDVEESLRLYKAAQLVQIRRDVNAQKEEMMKDQMKLAISVAQNKYHEMLIEADTKAAKYEESRRKECEETLRAEMKLAQKATHDSLHSTRKTKLRELKKVVERVKESSRARISLAERAAMEDIESKKKNEFRAIDERREKLFEKAKHECKVMIESSKQECEAMLETPPRIFAAPPCMQCVETQTNGETDAERIAELQKKLETQLAVNEKSKAELENLAATMEQEQKVCRETVEKANLEAEKNVKTVEEACREAEEMKMINAAYVAGMHKAIEDFKANHMLEVAALHASRN